MKTFKKIAIANRGEIAVRIIKTLKEMGISSVLLHSAEDQDSMAARLADETLCIGPGELQESYLNLLAVIEGAQSSGACALHPGVGFLSERALLAEACLKKGIEFIGPPPEQLHLFENKISALKYAASLGVPTLPFCTEEKEIEQIGWPVMIKLSFGGGGVGIFKAAGPKDFKSALEKARRLGESVFGSGEIFFEKYLEKARHIEVQIFGSPEGKVISLGERDCSIQRRNQKVIEQAPSFLSKELKDQMVQSACLIASSTRYKNAGTVEFLVKGDEFYFMEMNTRLQVEHPTTEMIFGLDLVKAQILTAEGKDFFDPEKPLKPRGWAIEGRIYFQDENHIPASGKLAGVKWLSLPHSRLDMGYESYDLVSPHYDPMMGKAIAWGGGHKEAAQKLKCLLQNSFVFGLPTNMAELIDILSDPDYLAGRFSIGSHPKNKQKIKKGPLSDEEIDWILKQAPASSKRGVKENKIFNPWLSPWPH